MRKNLEWQPEYLDNSSYRVKVIGGWIVYSVTDYGICNMFVRDQDHEWTIKRGEKQPAPPAVVFEDFGSPTL